MLGLIKKDLYLTIESYKTLLISYTVIAAIGSLSNNVGFMIAYIVALSVSIPLATFNMDKECNWEQRVFIVPNGKKLYPLAKYITTAIIMVLLFVVSIVVVGIIDILHIQEVDLMESAKSAAMICIGTYFVVTILMFPVIIKYGADKGRIVAMLVMGISIGLGIGIRDIVTQNLNIFINNSNILIIVTIVVALILEFLSIKLSQKFLSDKEV